MIYAVLADVHGNSTALEAVLQDCKNSGIQQYILLGDLYTKGSDPHGVYSQITQLDVMVNILGNTEQWIYLNHLQARERILASYMKAKMLPHEIAECSKMQKYQIMDHEIAKLLFIHDATDQQVDIINKDIKSLGKKLIVIAGHTHIPKIDERDAITYWNPGSVGMPYDQDKKASYGIITMDQKIEFKIKRVSYDVEQEKRNADLKFLPFIEDYCRSIEYGVQYRKR